MCIVQALTVAGKPYCAVITFRHFMVAARKKLALQNNCTFIVYTESLKINSNGSLHCQCGCESVNRTRITAAVSTKYPKGASSCKETYNHNPNSPSGYYWRDSSPPVQPHMQWEIIIIVIEWGTHVIKTSRNNTCMDTQYPHICTICTIMHVHACTV